MSKQENGVKEPSFIMLQHRVLQYKYTKSRLVFVDGRPEEVEVTLLDKVIFIHMKNRYDYFTSRKDGKYYESYQQIAEPLGIDKKSVARFVQKWKSHGFIEYYNGAGNRVNYTKLDCMFLGALGKEPENEDQSRDILKHLLEVPMDDGSYIPEFDNINYDYNFEQQVGLV